MKSLSVQIETECVHCATSMRLTIDSDLNHGVGAGRAGPLVFEPEVDWSTFTEPNITRAYCRNSVFLCSEEHAREFRAREDCVNGLYLTLDQSAYSTRIVQGALFAFQASSPSGQSIPGDAGP